MMFITSALPSFLQNIIVGPNTNIIIETGTTNTDTQKQDFYKKQQ